MAVVSWLEKVLVTNEFIGYAYAGYLVRFRFNKTFTDPNFLWLVTTSPFFRKLIETPLRTTVGINNINIEEMSNLFIPLPPLAEQKRIVKKLEEIMNLCEELKTTITDNQNYTDQLLHVALKDALQPKEIISKKEIA